MHLLVRTDNGNRRTDGRLFTITNMIGVYNLRNAWNSCMEYLHVAP